MLYLYPDLGRAPTVVMFTSQDRNTSVDAFSYWVLSCPNQYLTTGISDTVRKCTKDLLLLIILIDR